MKGSPLLHLIALLLILGDVVTVIAQNIPRSQRRFRESVGKVVAQQLILQGDGNADTQLSKAELTEVLEKWYTRLDPDGLGSLSQEEFLLRIGDASRAQSLRGSRALSLLTVIDSNQDSKLTAAELTGTFDRWFGEWDKSKDGVLDQTKLASGLDAELPLNNFSGATWREEQVRPPGLPTPPPSPVLTPQASLETVQLVEGFHLELAASDPMIEDPVAISFDEDGRLYVLEMRSYQLDIDRTHERDPISRISLLEDTDQDGTFDKSTVFLDGLILPRALAAIHGGVMVVSDHKLYFAQDTDDDGRADLNVLLDPDYGRGNVEHAPNGLIPAMDNWIYNAKSRTRYRWIGDTLIKQPTEFRGQWGMSQDNYGRLIYNVNNSQLLGDYTPPNYMERNPNYETSAGLNLFVSTDQRIFSIRMNTGVNRGYLPDVLNDKGRLHVFASSCSPLVYRGDNFPSEYVGNAFVADPAAHIIKRNLVYDDNLTLASRFAYSDREFLASTDERFRPVNLYNGPDGTLWVVDLYRGIVQYTQYMTPYLRSETLERELDQGIHFGRIYRIVSNQKAPSKPLRLSLESSAKLVSRLSHANGWVRDTAQRLLIERGDLVVVSPLIEMVSQASNHLDRVHALWTLEGLTISKPAAEQKHEPYTLKTIEGPVAAFESPAVTGAILDVVRNAIHDAHPKVRVAALRVAESLTASDLTRRQALLHMVSNIDDETPSEVSFQVALTAGNLTKPQALPVLARIASQQAQHLLIRDAIVSGLYQWELQFLQILLTDPQWLAQKPGRTALLRALANAITEEKQASKIELLLTLVASQDSEPRLWRQHALLAGMASHANGRIRQRIFFPREPDSLRKLALSDHAQIRESVEQIRRLFSWPGYQSDDAITTPNRALTSLEETKIAKGKVLYSQICAGCHGAEGEGLFPVAPPLLNSEWVIESTNRLVRIILQGAQGPFHVDGTAYQPPAVLPEMPPLAALDDAQLSAVLSYIRHDWGHDAPPVDAEQIATIRKATSSRTAPWTESELLEIE